MLLSCWTQTCWEERTAFLWQVWNVSTIMLAAVSAILVVFLNFKCQVPETSFPGKQISMVTILVTTYFNLKIAYLSKVAFPIIYHIIIDVIQKNGFSRRVKLENIDLSKGNLLLYCRTCHWKLQEKDIIVPFPNFDLEFLLLLLPPYNTDVFKLSIF